MALSHLNDYVVCKNLNLMEEDLYVSNKKMMMLLVGLLLVMLMSGGCGGDGSFDGDIRFSGDGRFYDVPEYEI